MFFSTVELLNINHGTGQGALPLSNQSVDLQNFQNLKTVLIAWYWFFLKEIFWWYYNITYIVEGKNFEINMQISWNEEGEG